MAALDLCGHPAVRIVLTFRIATGGGRLTQHVTKRSADAHRHTPARPGVRIGGVEEEATRLSVEYAEALWKHIERRLDGGRNLGRRRCRVGGHRVHFRSSVRVDRLSCERLNLQLP